MSTEPILDPNNQRFTLFPIQYPDLWKLYELQLSSFWKASEVDFSKDYDAFQLLSSNEQFYVKRILAFFSFSDGLVNFNINTRFNNEIKIMEALICYQYQTMMENIHSESYSLMLDNLVRNSEEKHLLFNALHSVPSMKLIGDWAMRWIDSPLAFSYRLVAFMCLEGILFSSAFAGIFWLKRYKTPILEGLTKSNDFIARDEGLHVQFGIALYKHLKNPLAFDELLKVVKEAVMIAKEFSNDAIPCRLISMNSESMCDYIEYVADTLLVQLGYSKYYSKTNPFDFMATISLDSKSNFFETRPTSYQSAYTQSRTNEEIQIVEDF